MGPGRLAVIEWTMNVSMDQGIPESIQVLFGPTPGWTMNFSMDQGIPESIQVLDRRAELNPD